MDTAEVIDRYYGALNEADWVTWLGFFADDVIVDAQLDGHSEGIEALREAVGTIGRRYARFVMEPEHVLVHGNQAAVFWHCEATTITGDTIDARGANYFRMRDGRIAYFRNVHDLAPFRAVVDQTG
jgi:ketosteroid isomerase-like protein